MSTLCGNASHPRGAWHPATPLPYSWHYVIRAKRWMRKRRYGCGCAA